MLCLSVNDFVIVNAEKFKKQLEEAGATVELK